MFKSIINFFKKQNNLLHRIHNANTYFFVNAYVFLFKLTNWTTFYIYVVDTLRAVTIRVYDKDWDKIFMNMFFSYTFITIVLMQL